MSHESKATTSVFNLKSPWQLDSHPAWIASLITLKRNLSPYKFPEHEEKSRKQHLLELISSAIKENSHLENPEILKADEIDFTTKEYLLEHFLASEEFYQIHESEAFVFDKGSKFLGIINFKEHLELTYLETKQELESGWNELLKIEGDLGKKITYSFDSRFGYLTSNPYDSGTGLHVTLVLHLPATIHLEALPELLEHTKEEEVEVRTLQGTAQDVVGDLLLVRNHCSIGLAEESIITSMRMWATKAMVGEMNYRKKILESQDATIKTKITRALGLLGHSFQIELVEALNALSLVKLGVEIGWLEAPKDLNLNALMFGCRRAHLMRAMGEKFDASEIPKKRAEYLQNIAKSLKLKI